MTKRSLEVHGSVRARLRVMNSYKIGREVHTSVTAGEVHGSVRVL